MRCIWPVVCAVAALMLHSALAACPSATFVDDDLAVIAHSPPPAPVAAAWPGDAPPPITAATSDKVVVIPRPTAPAASEYAQRSGCPHLAAGLRAWHHPDTWAGAGGVPAAGADVTVPVGAPVLISSCSLEAGGYGTIEVPEGATLVFADASIALHARQLNVAGALVVGSSTCRVRSQVSITLHGTRGDGGDKGLVVTGSLDLHGELYFPTWSRLAKAAAAGDASIYLQDCVNWRPGQQAVVTTTEYKDSRNFNRNEVRTVSAVECLSVPDDGVGGAGASTVTVGRVTFDTALSHSHYAAAHEYQAEVGLISRSVVVEGAAGDSEPTDTSPSQCGDDKYSRYPCPDAFLTGHGAHLKVMGEGVGRLSGTEFRRMGQTNVEGKYPVHYHLVHDLGTQSYVRDCAIHTSYHRAIVTHGTNGLLLSQNVAYDCIGHAFYMESGNEVENVWEFNLNGADVEGGPNLAVPADITASPYYITNLWNTIRGNAAVGGWSGFSLPNLVGVIGPERNLDPSYVPEEKPTLVFDGNSARSSGYWWSNGACFYSGGRLWYDDPATNVLTYNGGRNLGHARNPVAADGSAVWNKFTNTKVALCGRGFGDWNKRSEWDGFEVYDLRDHSMHVFGDVWFNNAYVKCRTENEVTTDGTLYWEKRYNMRAYKAFRSYDTGNRHILSNWRIDSCNDMGDPSGAYSDARIWTLPAGVNMPQYQLAIKGVAYEGPLYEPARLSLEEVRMDRFGKNFMSLIDEDGSLTDRGVRTIVGPTRGNKFWMLEDVEADPNAGCEEHPGWDYAMWACDAGDRRIASMEFTHASSALSWQERVGTINHWGYAASRAAEIGGDTAIIGPYHHEAVGGWFVSLDKGGPVQVAMERIQVAKGTTLMLALAYPAGTTFTVQASVTGNCNPGNGLICEQTLTDAGSVDAVRAGAGDTYHFDGTYLYLKVVSMARQQSGWRFLGYTATGWDEVSEGDPFTRGGVTIDDRGSSKYRLTVTAACTPSASDPDYCDGAVATTPPPAGCAAGEVQVGVDKCAAAPVAGAAERLEVRAATGGLPLVLTVPHGGDLAPTAMPDRQAGCYDAATGTCSFGAGCGTPDDANCGVGADKDYHAVEVVDSMSDALFVATGHRPHVVISHMHRRKVDVNAPPNEGAQGDADAAQAYSDYHDAVEAAVAQAVGSCGVALVVDVHTQDHAEEWTEVGYGISGATLDASTDAELEDQGSTFDSLLADPSTTAVNSVAAAVRGPDSLGALLASGGGYTVVPSPAHPGPAGGSYVDGDGAGETARRWGVGGAHAAAARVDALQLEVSRRIRYGGRPEHSAWGEAFAAAVQAFMAAAYDVTPDGTGCPASATPECPSATVPNAYWFDGAVWDDSCSVALHGACPPADASRQMSYTVDGATVTLTRRLDAQQQHMVRRDVRCEAGP